MSKKIAISKYKLEELYVKNQLSSYSIAKIYSCDPTVIQKRLKEYNIPTRQPKRRIKIDKRELVEFYTKKKLSSYKIAKRLNVGRTTVYMRLRGYNIKTRPLKVVYISKERLKDLYIKKRLSLSQIAKKYNCSHSIILDKLKRYDIKRRNKSEANTIYQKKRFDGNVMKKAYMIGFRLGDLKAIQVDNNCNVVISTNTTKLEQVDLIRSVFGCYGHFYEKEMGGVYYTSCQLDKSFHFLVKKKDEIESWILNNENYFFAFLAGYVDAEGNIGIYDNKARFRVGSYDKFLLHQVYEKLNSLGIHTKYRIDSKKGKNQNQDFWRVSINHKLSLLRFFKLIKPHLKHRKRVNDLKRAERNILERNAKYGLRGVVRDEEGKVLRYNTHILHQ